MGYGICSHKTEGKTGSACETKKHTQPKIIFTAHTDVKREKYSAGDPSKHTIEIYPTYHTTERAQLPSNFVVQLIFNVGHFAKTVPVD